MHLAAQPIVRDSYKDPRYTYETNVMGTVNLLECVRLADGTPPRSVVNITTDKVYHNNEWEWGYRENDSLDGFDPYSNSKSCSELVTHSYKNSFLNKNRLLFLQRVRVMSSAEAILPMIVSFQTASEQQWKEKLLLCGTRILPVRISMYWSLCVPI